MALVLEVTCISKNARNSPYERITDLSVRDPNGRVWRCTQQNAVLFIEQGKWELFVVRGGLKSKVLVSVSRFGNKYLKTENDGEYPDNLLSLPECG